MVYSVTDKNGATTSEDLTFTITIHAAPNFSGTVEDQIYTATQAITPLPLSVATGGTGNLTYTLPGLPTGLSFDGPKQELSGTPASTTVSSSSYTYTVTDENGRTDTEDFTITINAAPSFSATVNSQDHRYTVSRPLPPNSALPAATGGTGTLRYALAIQDRSVLPKGLNFNNAANSRVLSGTPTIPGTYNMTYTVTDDNGALTPLNFTITVNAAPSFSETVENSSYARLASFSITLPLATGGASPLTHTLRFRGQDIFPPGVQFNNQTLSGAIDVDGNYNLIYTATDKNGAAATLTFGIEIRFDRPEPTSLNFSGTVAPQPYTVGQNISTLTLPTATGGTGDIRYELAIQGEPRLPDDSPPLPGGLAFNNAANTLTLSGIPTTARSYNMIYTATDANGFPATLFFTITINPENTPTPPALTFSQPSFDVPFTAEVELSTPYQLPTVSGGSGNNVRYVLSPATSLSALTAIGLTLSGDHRTISGTPTQALGQTTFTYTATDDDARVASINVPVLITVFSADTPTALTFSQPSFDVPFTAEVELSTPYQLPTVSGGSGNNVRYVLSPATSLSALTAIGLTLSGDHRTISGTPTQALAQTTFTYTATDDDARVASINVPVLITVFSADTPTALTFSQPSFDVPFTAEVELSTPYQLPTVSGGSGNNVRYVLSPATSLSALTAIGLTLSGDHRTISGTPTQALAQTTFTYTATDDDARVASINVPVLITVFSADTPTALTFSQPSFDVPFTAEVELSTPYQLPTVSGGSGNNVRYVLSPATSLSALTAIGLTLSGDHRTISGTPTQALAQTTFTYTATDDDARVASINVPVLITVFSADTPTALTFSQPSFDVPFTAEVELSTPYQLPTVSGGSGNNVRYVLSPATSLSALTAIGLTLSGDHRTISGTPTQALAQTTFTYTATDDDARVASINVPVLITVFSADTPTALTFSQPSFDVPFTAEVELSTPYQLPTVSGGSGNNVRYVLSPATSLSALTAIGLTLSGDHRTISGTPTQALAQTTFTYTATDDDARVASINVPVLITVFSADTPTALTFSQPSFDVPFTAEVELSTPYQLPTVSGGSGNNVRYVLSPATSLSALTAIGLTLSGDHRTISGTPTQALAQTTFTYTATDDDARVASINVPVLITVFSADTPTALTFSQPSFDVPFTAEVELSTPYQLPTVSGGSGNNVRYVLSPATSLSALTAIGLTLSGDHRTISGTPTQALAQTTFTYTATDDDARVASINVPVLITVFSADTPTALTFSQPSFDVPFTAEVELSTPYQLPTVSGGSGNNVRYVLSPATSLSALTAIGLTLSGDHRTISGTPTQALAQTTFTYTATDDDARVASINVPVLITVFSADTPTALTFSQPSFDVPFTAEVELSTPYQLPTVSGGSGNNVRYVLSPATSLSALTAIGLTLSGDHRTISGTPTQALAQTTFTYTATDDDARVASINVPVLITVFSADTPTALTFSQPSFDVPFTAEVELSTPYQLPTVSGGSGNNVRYVLSPATSLSALTAIGLTLSGDHRTISGTPTQALAQTTFTYTATDDDARVASINVPVLITVFSADTPTALTFSQPSFDVPFTAEVELSTPYQLPTVSGGSGNNVRYVLSPATSLSALTAIGLTLSGDHRTISGTPTQALAQTTFTYTATDDDARVASINVPVLITVFSADTPTALTFSQPSFDVPFTAEVELSTPYQLPTVSGGSGNNVRYVLSPATSLSALTAIGLTLSGDHRTISGTPTQALAQTTFTYTATDDDARVASINVPVLITVFSADTPTALTFSQPSFDVPPFTVGVALTTPYELPTVSGGSGSVTYSLSPALTAGLTLSGDARTISGTPTEDKERTEYTYTATDTDTSETATLRVYITIMVPSRQEDRLERVNQSTLSQATQVMAANVAASVVARIESLASGDGRASVQFAGQSSLHQALKSSEKLPNSGTLALEKLLDDSSFTLPLTATEADGAAGPGGIAVWGSGDYLKFSGGKDETMNWDGDMVSAHLGVDKRFRSNILAGLAASWYKGRLDYSDSTDAEVVRGMQENEMVVLHPYVGWTSSGGVSLWATLGYGWGDLDIVEASQDKLTSDSTLQTAAVGMGGNLLSSEEFIAGGTTTLRLKGDASYAKIKVKDNGAIRGLSIAVRRLRLSLEGSHEQRLASGDRLEPSVVVGLRHDSGDSETGTGIELGGGLRYIAPAAGLSLTGRGHVLVNGPGNYEEWGANLQFLLDPGIVHQGLSLNLRSLYGEMPSERLWDRDLTQVSAATINNINNKVLGHLDMEIGYGLAAPVGPALWTPYSGLMLSSDGKRGYRLGGRFEVGPLFELRLEGDRQEGTGSAQHGILLEGQLRF